MGVGGKAHRLRAVLFWPDLTSYLFRGYGRDGYSQLEAILQLIDFADAYVLNDQVAVAGPTWVGYGGPVSEFLASERRNGSIQSIGYQENHDLNINPFDISLGLPELERQRTAFDDLHSPEAWAIGERMRVLQAQTYIMLADREDASYIPERRYGPTAIATFGNVIREASYPFVDEFRNRLALELDVLPKQHATRAVTPCFFAEAVKNSNSPGSLLPTLREFRESAAARTYRDLLRTATSPGAAAGVRLEVARELSALSDSAFKREQMSSRIPKWFKWATGLSAAAIGVAFPAAALTAASVPFLLEAGDELSRWTRRRANIFAVLDQATDIDLYRELHRLFPHLAFGPDHLAHVVRHRNFGFPDSNSLVEFIWGEGGSAGQPQAPTW